MTELEAGDQAPYFEGIDQDGNKISLKDYKNEKLVLYFYPKDDTPGCTKEACSLRDDYEALEEAGYNILGVSPDPVEKHQKFIIKYNLPFPLLADTDKEVIEAYGVWGKKKFMGNEYDGVHRTTFLINEQGKIDHIFKKVKTKSHGQQILDEVS